MFIHMYACMYACMSVCNTNTVLHMYAADIKHEIYKWLKKRKAPKAFTFSLSLDFVMSSSCIQPDTERPAWGYLLLRDIVSCKPHNIQINDVFLFISIWKKAKVYKQTKKYDFILLWYFYQSIYSKTWSMEHEPQHRQGTQAPRQPFLARNWEQGKM